MSNPLWILLAGMVVVVGGILLLRLHAFLALLAGAATVGLLTPGSTLVQVSKMIGVGFGETAGELGILIAMASIIGSCLLDSGGADRIVRSLLRVMGIAQAPLAFLVSGFLLGIPVFFDTVFYLMIPLGKAMRLRSGGHYLRYVLSIVAGATMTHSLVPPTPGPLAVAGQLGIELGKMMIGGLIVSSVCCVFAYFYIRWADRKWDVPLRDSGDVSLAELEALAERGDHELPPLWLSLLPILLPVVLIGGWGAIESGYAKDTVFTGWMSLAQGLGDRNVALTISAAVAMGLMLWQPSLTREKFAAAVESSLLSAGMIILIIGAGGSFKQMLVGTKVDQTIVELTAGNQAWILPIAFLTTVAIRTSIGGATVGMMASAGIFAAAAKAGELAFDPVYLALAICCGTKPGLWMNDSGFWVISKMSGMTEAETLKTATVMNSVMGVIGLLVLMLGAAFKPYW